MDNLKEEVKKFWGKASCGEELYLNGFENKDYVHQLKKRYQLEPEILSFGEFDRFYNKKVLEIGVGLGADHQMLAEAGAFLTGIDITERAINHTKHRFQLLGLKSNLLIADVENLPFENNSFDAIYSWGVIHHTPNTNKAISEIYRVLKQGGFAKIMIYHKYSVVGFMLWFRYGILRFRPFISLNKIYSLYLESPGTKAYSLKKAKTLFREFTIKKILTPLNHADLLISDIGQRHRGNLLSFAKRIWPRYIIKKFFPKNGLEMMIEIEKPLKQL